MKHVICPICGSICIKHGKLASGSQRWFCKNCNDAKVISIQNTTIYP